MVQYGAGNVEGGAQAAPSIPRAAVPGVRAGAVGCARVGCLPGEPSAGRSERPGHADFLYRPAHVAGNTAAADGDALSAVAAEQEAPGNAWALARAARGFSRACATRRVPGTGSDLLRRR